MTAPAPDEGLRARLSLVIWEHLMNQGWEGVGPLETDDVADAILAVLAAVGPDSTGGQGESVVEWAVDFAGGNWQERGWLNGVTEQQAAKRASERLGARVMRREVTPWVDVTPQEVIRKAADRSRAKHGITPWQPVEEAEQA